MENNAELIAQCEAKAKQWLAPEFDEETKKAIEKMLDDKDKTIPVDIDWHIGKWLRLFIKIWNLVPADYAVLWELAVTE